VVPISVRLSPELLEKVDDRTDTLQLSRNNFIEIALTHIVSLSDDDLKQITAHYNAVT